MSFGTAISPPKWESPTYIDPTRNIEGIVKTLENRAKIRENAQTLLDTAFNNAQKNIQEQGILGLNQLDTQVLLNPQAVQSAKNSIYEAGQGIGGFTNTAQFDATVDALVAKRLAYDELKNTFTEKQHAQEANNFTNSLLTYERIANDTTGLYPDADKQLAADQLSVLVGGLLRHDGQGRFIVPEHLRAAATSALAEFPQRQSQRIQAQDTLTNSLENSEYNAYGKAIFEPHIRALATAQAGLEWAKAANDTLAVANYQNTLDKLQQTEAQFTQILKDRPHALQYFNKNRDALFASARTEADKHYNMLGGFALKNQAMQLDLAKHLEAIRQFDTSTAVSIANKQAEMDNKLTLEQLKQSGNQQGLPESSKGAINRLEKLGIYGAITNTNGSYSLNVNNIQSGIKSLLPEFNNYAEVLKSQEKGLQRAREYYGGTELFGAGGMFTSELESAIYNFKNNKDLQRAYGRPLRQDELNALLIAAADSKAHLGVLFGKTNNTSWSLEVLNQHNATLQAQGQAIAQEVIGALAQAGNVSDRQVVQSLGWHKDKVMKNYLTSSQK